MRYYFLLILILFSWFLQGCDLRQREEALKEKETTLNQREQELLLKEKTLQLKEEDLVKREQRIDSTRILDSMSVYNASLPGTWDVKMVGVETTCPSSAVGDTKNETWEITYQENNVIAKAMVNNELVRTYSGLFTGNTLELVDTRENIPGQPPTRIVVRLRMAKENVLEGTREIERIGECKIVYQLSMNKKVTNP